MVTVVVSPHPEKPQVLGYVTRVIADRQVSSPMQSTGWSAPSDTQIADRIDGTDREQEEMQSSTILRADRAISIPCGGAGHWRAARRSWQDGEWRQPAGQGSQPVVAYDPGKQRADERQTDENRENHATPLQRLQREV